MLCYAIQSIKLLLSCVNLFACAAQQRPYSQLKTLLCNNNNNNNNNNKYNNNNNNKQTSKESKENDIRNENARLRPSVRPSVGRRYRYVSSTCNTNSATSRSLRAVSRGSKSARNGRNP